MSSSLSYQKKQKSNNLLLIFMGYSKDQTKKGFDLLSIGRGAPLRSHSVRNKELPAMRVNKTNSLAHTK